MLHVYSCEKQFTKVYFVRHAQAEQSEDDRTRPLTAEGEKDSGIVPELLKDKEISVFYCSPYRRSLDTIRLCAEQYHMEIHVDERLRERTVGVDGHSYKSLHKRWEDFHYHEENGESLAMVQERNMEALREILAKHKGENIVIGTHGTALSTILAYYQPDLGCKDFLRITAWMPNVVELDFEGQELRDIVEHGYVDKGK